MPTSIAAIILAAGSSSRIGNGRHKLLLPLGKRAVLSHVIETALASQAHPIIIVLGHQADQVCQHIAEHMRHSAIMLVENPDYLQGMSTSLRVGLRTLLHEDAHNAVDGVVILLGDQPLLTSSIIDTLITTRYATGKRIIAPLYAGKRGNPVLFERSLFAELMEVTGDEGGRSVIERHREDMATIAVDNAVADYDVDTWEAYQQAVKVWQQTRE